MTSKEALDYLTSTVFTGGNPTLEAEAKVCKEIILKDLERLEVLEKENIKLKFENASLNNAIDLDLTAKFLSENIKLKKVIKLLKEKRIIVGLLCDTKSVEEYNKHFKSHCKLTEKEYELLKEVL